MNPGIGIYLCQLASRRGDDQVEARATYCLHDGKLSLRANGPPVHQRHEYMGRKRKYYQVTLALLYMYQVFIGRRCKCFHCKFPSKLMNKHLIYNNFPLFLSFAISTNNEVVLCDRNHPVHPFGSGFFLSPFTFFFC